MTTRSAAQPPRPRAEVVIDLDAVRHNVGILVGCAAASGAATMAVVKADGYGHGALDVAEAALQAGATALGVCSVEEALSLRCGGVDAPVLAWLHAPGEDLAAGVAAGVDLGVYSTGQLDTVAAAAATGGRTARVHLKVDTGLTRGGAHRDQWPGLLRAAVATRGVEVVAIWSHLAHADDPAHPIIERQVRYFDEAYRMAWDAGLRPLRHLANSAATLTRPDLHYDLVRPGIAVYGLSPVPGVGYHLLPAMTLRSQVAMVKRVPAGEGVSYGHVWHTARETTLALVPAGYADGVPRMLTGRLDVWLAGRRRPVVGRVCMDQVMVDCGDDPVAEGAEVVFFGPGQGGAPTAAEWADKLGTIHYEVVAGMVRPRLTRTVRGRRSPVVPAPPRCGGIRAEHAGDAGMSVVIGPMSAADVHRCAELEHVLFDIDDPWNQAVFIEALAAGHHYLSARDGDSLVGYVGLARSGGEAEVHTLAVDPAYQRRGIGRALLRAVLDHAVGATVFLEVRTDNESAIQLYRSEGFDVIGIRRGYYQASGADAFTMRRQAHQ